MILCTINGQKAYPVINDNIKVTYENQYIKDAGSYTYDITFPLCLKENQKIFGLVHRFEVHKSIADFEDCKLYAANRLIIAGKGHVTTVTDNAVKIQIIAEQSRLKYNAKFKKHYIDEINFPDVKITQGLNWSHYSDSERVNGITVYDKKCGWWQSIHVLLTDSSFVGSKGVASFNPIRDETNERTSNQYTMTHLIDGGEEVCIIGGWLAVQPNLMYVLQKAINFEGYTISYNEYDREPWNRLYIASAFRTVSIKNALPHWTVYKFLDEFRKLFNASFIFDELKKTVAIKAQNDLTTNDVVSYDTDDEFTSEYEDDGLTTLATSNVEYDLGSSINRDWREVIPQVVTNNYDTIDFTTVTALVDAAAIMTERKRRQTIFRCEGLCYIWAKIPEKPLDDDSAEIEQRTSVGIFSPLIRDKDSDDFIDLKMAPVSIFQTRQNASTEPFPSDSNYAVIIPSVPNEKEESTSEMEEDEEGYYNTVQNAIDDTSVLDKTVEEDDDTIMYLMFQGNNVVNVEAKTTSLPEERPTTEHNINRRYPVNYTDSRMWTQWSGDKECASLSLVAKINKGDFRQSPHYIGGYASKLSIDKANQITIKFYTDDIPDPSKIYIFRNKRYICSKIECNLSDGKVDKKKTGYFYESL